MTGTDRTNVLVLASAFAVSLLALEFLARLFLPPPPAFPTGGGIHLLLADALRTDVTSRPWDTLCKDIVCAITYGDEYRGIYDFAGTQPDIVIPRTFSPRTGATRRVLHLGDSITFGFGLPRNQTFTAELDRLEPGAEHINAAIPGTAPDAYLAVLQRWLASGQVDVVVMHVYEGNDLDGLDSRYPCCGWQPLLAYENGTAALRCAHGTVPDFSRAGWAWLRDHNPPPYLLRALIGTSAAAAHIAAAMARESYLLVDQPLETRLAHLESILRSAGDVLAARRIPFVVDVVPARSWLEDGLEWQRYGPRILDVARRLGIAAVDGSGVFRDAAAHGQKLFFDNGDIHFNATGHLVWARWLHDQLRAVAPDHGASSAVNISRVKASRSHISVTRRRAFVTSRARNSGSPWRRSSALRNAPASPGGTSSACSSCATYCSIQPVRVATTATPSAIAIGRTVTPAAISRTSGMAQIAAPAMASRNRHSGSRRASTRTCGGRSAGGCAVTKWTSSGRSRTARTKRSQSRALSPPAKIRLGAG